MHPPERDWALVGPWWSWADPARTPTGRVTRPILQKYETSDPVTEFIENPQRCLRYLDDDVVPQYRRKYVPLRKATPGFGKLRILAARDAIEQDPSDGQLKSYVDERVPRDDGLRKIFLDTHKRFYLVVCQIHCNAPGFPKVARDRICEAGFLVRRRTTEAPATAAKEAKTIIKNLSKQRAQLQKLEAVIPKIRVAAMKKREIGGVVMDDAKLDVVVKQRAFVAALLLQEQQRLASWAARFDVAPTVQGWFPMPGLDHVGQWQLVDETPDDLDGESSFPLYPLIPSEDDREHAGHFGTVYFGLLPAQLADHDANGRARFKEQEYYEVRCWAKRHEAPHDPGAPCECPDRLFWSAPTEPYWLAGHYDLIGTSQRPVTIQLPDLKDLAADPKPRTGATFSKPPGSLAFSVGADQKPTKLPGTGPGFQICTLPIPLITIVAMFVFELFLPIVVFVFGLFWMLLLKFCIPPEIDVGAGLTLELAAQAPALGLSLDATGNIDMSLTSDAAEDGLKLTEGWKIDPKAVPPPPPPPPVDVDVWVSDLLDEVAPPPSPVGGDLQAKYSSGAIVNWQKTSRAAGTTDIPDVTATLQFVEEKKHP